MLPTFEGRRERCVLVLNHFAVPRGCAGGTRHVELFSRLPGWKYTIFASRTSLTGQGHYDAADGFTFVPATPFRSNGVARVMNWASYSVTATVAALCARQPDVVYASTPHLLAGFAGWIVAKIRRARFVLEVRDLWPQVLVDMDQLSEKSVTYRALRQLECFLYRRADHIVILAAGIRAAVEDAGARPEAISHIPNAADSGDFFPSAERSELRARFGFTEITAIYAGAHGPANGLDLILDAAIELDDTPMQFVLMGSGVEKSRLEQRAQRLCLGAKVRFLDPVPKCALPDLLNAADIGVHSLADVPLFRYGVSPNKIYDYMSAALPIVTNTPGEVAGLVVEAGAGVAVGPAGLARGIRELAELSPEQRVAIGESGRNWLDAGNSRTSAAEKLLSLLEQISPYDGKADGQVEDAHRYAGLPEEGRS